MTKNQMTTIFVVVIASFVTTFTASALNLSIPTIDAEFQAGATRIGWIINGYILASAALSVPFGRLADLTQRKKVLVTGILTFSLCTGAINFAWSIQVFILLRILQGIGAAMIFSTNQAVLISAFPPEKRGKILGYSIASTYMGLTAGPVVGGFLNHTLGWRSIFVLTFLISITVFLIAWRFLPAVGNGVVKEGMDLLGSLLYAGMIVSLMVGFSSISATPMAWLLIPLGVGLFVAFVVHEKKTESPVVQVRLFTHNISYTFSNLAALLNYGATFAIGYLLSIYLQVVKGYGSEVAGFILISQPLIMAILSPYAGRLSDRISPFRLASFGMALCTLGLFSYVFVSIDYPLPWIIVNLVVVGVGFAFFSSPNTNAVMACVKPADYGVATSVLSTMRTIGQGLSMAVISLIVAHNLGNVALAKADIPLLVSTMRITFLVFAILGVVGILISLKRKDMSA